MKGREGKGAPSADLLVCFPSRAHLTLMPKPICSPARPSEPNKGSHNHHHHHNHNHHHLRKPSYRGAGGGGAGQASPMLWSKTKQMGSDISEPTSPKVTCAGQIKVRPKPNSSCKNWQSVMEEIERLHNHKKHKKKPTWVEALGFKKEIVQFLTCLRSIRFDFRCSGTFPTSDITSDDEDDDEEDKDYQENQVKVMNEGDESSRAVFSKWFMVLQENQSHGIVSKEQSKEENGGQKSEYSVEAPCVPPSNALLLMRCRSAPAKSWLEEREEEEENEDDEDEDEEEKKEEEEKNRKLGMEEEKRKKESLQGAP
ncbi:hypothetical protein RJ639_033518 [Escallonia herrerae]|uniref:Uncharacterized protein n=1 Tax=Escallonia herrerae TaxID=1293975 RepID=A0AA89BB21_9ASTE|nr:hypothetical protein RJ639_033518 [Escallonia herrerae]